MPTNASEKSLERLICKTLTGHPCDPPASQTVSEPTTGYGGVGWSCGNPHDYDRGYCVDLVQLSLFLQTTQPDVADKLALSEDGPTRQKFLHHLRNQISKRGTIHVLRNGIMHGPYQLNLFYGTPSPGNETAKERFGQNRFTVTRQLRYSLDQTQHALDIGLFINGLPVFTFELKNNLTKQTVSDAVKQYQYDRNPKEKLFELGRCLAHFAVDEGEVQFCTHLKGKSSWFLPFNRGWNDGAGNPPNPNGIKTEYLWREVLSRGSLTNIIENYAQLVVSKDKKSDNKGKTQTWPRYHQLDVVRKLLADASSNGAGKRYLIQHSAGSGKSNSIAWLAHQLIGLMKEGKPVFDSIIVVTDRRILDRQINDTIKLFVQVKAVVGHAVNAGDLHKYIHEGKKIIISTVQKFPFVLKEIGNQEVQGNFAIIIDEAHSSQGGRMGSAMAKVLAESGEPDEEETFEDQINRLIDEHKLLPNASYFAFTATPKNKTLEIFGDPEPQADGTVRHRAFHSYTMKQAIQEGFIQDVLEHYTPVESYYKLAKTVEDDPKFDTKKAQKKLRRFVEESEHAIRHKAEIMVDHFHDQVLTQKKISGQARAMVVTNGIKRAIQYYHSIRKYLKERNSPYEALVAFSGEYDYGEEMVSEVSLNKIPSNQIADRFREDPYRFLICADKFQTGYDEPLLHTMYVDKTLSGIKAVQTLSRLNRSHPDKHDVFVLDFLNDTDTIQAAFSDYYRTTILSEETDPNKLHDLQADLDYTQVYSQDQIDDFVKKYLADAGVEQLLPILDACVAVYKENLDEDEQVEFKGKVKGFTRTYAFLSSVLPYNNPEWEKRSIFLNFLVSKLPAPGGDDLSKGILEAIDLDSYRVEKKAMQKILLLDEDAEIGPIPTDGGGSKPEPEMDLLSNILKEFNELFGDTQWEDKDRIIEQVYETIPAMVSENTAFKNALKNSDKQNARIEHDKALLKVMTSLMKDDTQLFKKYVNDQEFKHWMNNTVFELTYKGAGV